MRTFYVALRVLAVGFVIAISLFVILHEVRGRQARREMDEELARSDALDEMRANGFSDINIIDAKRFMETRRCYDFRVSATDSSGEAVWGHFYQCDPVDGSEWVNYVVNDFCKEGAIECSSERKEYECE